MLLHENLYLRNLLSNGALLLAVGLFNGLVAADLEKQPHPAMEYD